MQWNKSTRYALYAMTEMAAAGTALVTVGAVAEKYGMPQSALAKVFQQLVRAGLAISLRGVGGGYRLSKPPSEFTVLEVMDVFEPRTQAHGHCLVGPSDRGNCRLTLSCKIRKLFDEVDGQMRSTFGSVTLETLASSSLSV